MKVVVIVQLTRAYPMSDEQTNQSWGGRFTESTDAFVAAFTASVDFDRRMYQQDIDGSIAHAREAQSGRRRPIPPGWRTARCRRSFLALIS